MQYVSQARVWAGQLKQVMPGCRDEVEARLLVVNCEFLFADLRSHRPSGKFSVILLTESLFYIDDYLGAMRRLVKDWPGMEYWSSRCTTP